MCCHLSSVLIALYRMATIGSDIVQILAVDGDGGDILPEQQYKLSFPHMIVTLIKLLD